MSLHLGKNLSSQLKKFTAFSFSPVNKFLHFQCNYTSSSSTSSVINESCNQDSFKVSYLVNTCGLTPKQALSVSKYVNFKTPENADSVIAFFKKHGFTNTQITNIVRKSPLILSSDCEKTILPKLEYFASVGFSSAVLTNFIATSPSIMRTSLENAIIPAWNFFKSVLMTNERTNKATKRFLATRWPYDIEARVMPNIEILREFGVIESSIAYLLANQPDVLKCPNDRFRITVEKVKQMGLNPQRVKFVLAVHALLGMSKLTWDKKVEFLKKWGWSEDDVYMAFSKVPLCMAVSENKMSSTMDMLINKSEFDHSHVVNWPQCLTHSFEKRVVPRCLFYQVLLERGLTPGRWKLSMLLGFTEAQFMKAVTKFYKEAAPELLQLYKGKLECATDLQLEV